MKCKCPICDTKMKVMSKKYDQVSIFRTEYTYTLHCIKCNGIFVGIYSKEIKELEVSNEM